MVMAEAPIQVRNILPSLLFAWGHCSDATGTGGQASGGDNVDTTWGLLNLSALNIGSNNAGNAGSANSGSSIGGSGC